MIRHLHISHDTPYSTPKIVDNLCCWFLQGITVVPREIERIVGGEGGGSKQGVLWEMCKWQIIFFLFLSLFFMYTHKCIVFFLSTIIL